MGTVGAGFSMSLDGFIAGENDDMQHIFGWMFQGDTVLPTAGEDRGITMPAESVANRVELTHSMGAIVSGRRTFDIAQAWGGTHPMGVPVVVLTHSVPKEWANHPNFTFVTEGGIERAIAVAKEIAGDKSVGVCAADLTQQCLKAGLLDELGIDLVPVLLGKGVPLFKSLGIEPVKLTIQSVVNTPLVTHLSYGVNK